MWHPGRRRAPGIGQFGDAARQRRIYYSPQSARAANVDGGKSAVTKRALLLAMLSGVPVAAHAQDAGGGGTTNASSVPANISVADRPRPEYEPIGGRIGSFFLLPRVDVTGEYNSNLRATPTDGISDATFTIRPSAELNSRWGRHAVDFRGYFLQTLHAKTTSEDFTNYGIGTLGRYDAGQATTISANASFDKLAEPRTDINSISGSRSPIQYRNYAAGLSVYQRFVAFDVSGSVGIQKQSFDDAVSLAGQPIDLEYRDNTSINGSLEGRKRLATGTTAIIHVETTRINYDLNPIGGVDRNSQSYRIEGGLGLALSRLIYGDVRVGYFKQDNDDPRFNDSTGLSFSANLLYSVTPLTSIRLTANRSVEPGGSTVSSGNVRSSAAVTVDHELRRNIVLSGFGSYSHVEAQTIGAINFADADEYQLRGSVLYYANRRLRLNASVAHIGRRSDVLTSFDVNLARAGVTLML